MTEAAIVTADAARVIRGWSSGAKVLFGHDAVAAIGQTLDLIVPENYRARHWAGFHAAIVRGKSDPNGVASVPVRRSDGSATRLAVRLMVLADAYGKGVGAVAVFAPLRDDVTLGAL